MDDAWICKRCNAVVPVDWRHDLCPRCMLGEVLSKGGVTSLTVTKAAETAEDAPAEGRIGPYTLLTRVGEGGMGEVWLAEQREPLRRRVALKLIKRGMDTRRVVARFEAERQALAMMDHPNVAKVLDAGVTPRGRPYFAMEYVKGVPITQHCDRECLTTRERLELFTRVCEGVQHAHQKGIIHRDLKPSNVLVTIIDDKPVPKIIDFGVAKAVEQRLTEKTLFTELGVLIGTPEYMSPEQAEMTAQDIDTRTDVYSLGVLLYQLLVGALPFDPKKLRQLGFDEIRRCIREEEPSKPSTRLTTLGEDSTDSARKRRTDLRGLKRQLSGDLDWITMKALEKNRTRRYGAPSDLAADVTRHLRNEPVLASPPSATYQIRKFVSRHRIGVGIAAAAIAILVGFAIRERIQSRRIATQRDRANQEAATAAQVSGFMAGLFEVASPSSARGRTVTAKEILDRGAEKIGQELEDEPLIQARLQRVMGAAYRDLGLLGDAEPLLDQALATHEKTLGPEDAEVASDLWELLNLYWERFDVSAFAEATERCLAIRRKVLDPEDPKLAESLGAMGGLILQTGRDEDAEPFLREALQIQEKALDPNDLDIAETLYMLGILSGHLHRNVDAIRYFERALGIYEANDSNHPDMVLSLEYLGSVLVAAGRLDEAEHYRRRAVELAETVLGPNHLRTADALAYLGGFLMNTERYGEAESLLRRVVEIRGQEQHDQAADPFFTLAMLECARDDHENTERELNRLLDRFADDPAWVLETRLGKFRLCSGDRRAIDHFERAIEAAIESLGPDHAESFMARAELASILTRFGDYESAAVQQSAALESARASWGEDNSLTLRLASELATAYSLLGRHADATSLQEDVLERTHSSRGKEPYALLAARVLGDVYRRAGRHEEARSLLREALGGQIEIVGERSSDVADTRYSLGCLAAATGQRREALDQLSQAVDLRWAERTILDEADLDDLRGEPEFEALVAEVKRRLKIKD